PAARRRINMSKLRPRPQALSNPRRRKSARHRSYLIDDFVRWQTHVAEFEAPVDELEAQLFKYRTPPTSAYARRMSYGPARRLPCFRPKPPGSPGRSRSSLRGTQSVGGRKPRAPGPI